MTDENVEVEQVEETEQEASVVDYEAEVLQLKADMERILSKNNELLGEKKKVQATNKALKADDDARARQNGEFEKLLEASEAERNKAYEELNSYKQKAIDSNIDTKALQITNELKAIPESADLLAHFIAMELKALADEKGEVSETALKALQHQFSNDEKYKPLLQGNLSNGGGATGAKSSAQSTTTIQQADWDKYSAAKKSSVAKDLASRGLKLSQVLEQ